MDRAELNARIEKSKNDIITLKNELSRVDDIRTKQILENEQINLNYLIGLFNLLNAKDVLGDELL